MRLDAERVGAFCPNCGSALASDIEETPGPSCAECGQSLEPEDLFCASCGAPTAQERASFPGATSSPSTQTRKQGLARAVRTGPWWTRLVAVLLVPFWATSEIRQASWRMAGRLAAIGGVWALTIGTVLATYTQTPLGTSKTSVVAPATEPPRISPVATASPLPTPEELSDAVPNGWPLPPSDAQEAFVVSVTDGDTIVLGGIDVGAVDTAGGRKTRLIGVDTPEVFGRAECYGSAASEFTKGELSRRTVLVDFDVQTTDRFGRALVYLWTIEGVLFNAKLVAEGYALQLTIPPNVRFAELFTALAREAREGNRGLWDACALGSPGGLAPSVGDPSSSDRDCSDFATHEEAQQFYEQQGGPGQDPHGLDADGDGVACEGLQSETQDSSTQGPPPTQPPQGGSNCHPSYPDFCIPPPPPDLDCPDVGRSDFTVRHDVPDPDPHRFDADHDGVGCES